MQTIGILILIFVACMIAFSFQGCRGSKPSGRSHDPNVTVQQVDSMTRARIEQMLGQLQKKKAPKPTIAAMCYTIAVPPLTAEYVCPECGQKTLYANDEARFVEQELESCRREFDQVVQSTNLKMGLDESSFCEKCSPNATQHQMILTLSYADGSTHSVSLRSGLDLRILRDFFRGQDAFEGDLPRDRFPLKDRIPRLRELLGVDDPASKGKP